MSCQVAVITGAAGGFGAAICKALLEVGYAVAATDVDAAALALLERGLASDRLFVFVMDVTDAGSVADTALCIEERCGPNMTVLVNNAGIIGRSFCLSDGNAIESRRVIDVNLVGSFNCTSVFSKYMARLKYGRIINISSVAGIWGAAGGAAYAASKAGLIKASESWARELGPLNISVTAIAPGVCKTPLVNQLVKVEAAPPDEDRIVKSVVPVGRWGTPDDVAEVVTFLSTCKTNYLNGAIIALDGGMRVGSI